MPIPECEINSTGVDIAGTPAYAPRTFSMSFQRDQAELAVSSQKPHGCDGMVRGDRG
jgi:hypothetical protein